MSWQPILTAPSGKNVLIHYLNGNGKSRIIKAFYAPRHYIDARPEDDDGAVEYCEERDAYYLAEGWWEVIDNWGEYSQIKVTEGEPDHWMPLPAPPNADVTGLAPAQEKTHE